MLVGGSPEYYVERKLGKGGFGQVFIGRRVVASKGAAAKEGSQATYVSSPRAMASCGAASAQTVHVAAPCLAGHRIARLWRAQAQGVCFPGAPLPCHAGRTQIRASDQQGLQLWPSLRVVGI